MEAYYKVLDEKGRSCHGGNYKWSLPTKSRSGKWKPGKWTPKRKRVEPCESGWHLCHEADLIYWLGATIYVAEVSEGAEVVAHKSPDGATKVVTGGPVRLSSKVEAWDERTARLFACDCAERALKRERKAGREPDERSWAAIKVARRHADGRATADELAAARDAAGDAALDAALDAAWAAARAATRAAALDAARDAALDAERKWQTRRLLKIIGATK